MSAMSFSAPCPIMSEKKSEMSDWDREVNISEIIDDDGLARARLARDAGESRAKLPREVFDEGEVLDFQEGKHGRRQAVGVCGHAYYFATMSAFELTFLGTGTSVGVPMIGCTCAVCTSADPRDRRTRASIFIECAEGPNILVDTSTDLRMQALTQEPTVVTIIMFSPVTKYSPGSTLAAAVIKAARLALRVWASFTGLF